MFKKIIEFIKRKKWLLIILVAIGLIVFFWIRNGQLKKKAAIKTSPVEKRDLTEQISASGKISAEEEVTLKFQASGRLAWVGVKKGDYVQQWQAIASLDRRELEKSLKQELLDYMDERWDFEQGRDDYNVHSDDLDKHTLSNAARRILEQNQFGLDRTVLDVQISDIALQYSTLITPIEGIVTEITDPYPGVNIVYTTTQFVVSNPKTMVFKAKVDEADIGKVSVGQKAIIKLDAYPDEEIEVIVSKIDFTATLTSGGGTAFEVTFSLPQDNENQKYKIDMNGDADIVLSKKNNVLVIPIEALRENEEGSYVWIMQNEKPQKKSVTTGLNDDYYLEILSGLNASDQVITSGFSLLEKKR